MPEAQDYAHAGNDFRAGLPERFPQYPPAPVPCVGFAEFLSDSTPEMYCAVRVHNIQQPHQLAVDTFTGAENCIVFPALPELQDFGRVCVRHVSGTCALYAFCCVKSSGLTGSMNGQENLFCAFWVFYAAGMYLSS